MLGFEGTFNRDAQVFRLITRQFGQVDCQSRQVSCCNLKISKNNNWKKKIQKIIFLSKLVKKNYLFVQFFVQHENSNFGVFLGVAPQIDLSQDLIGEWAAHHKSCKKLKIKSNASLNYESLLKYSALIFYVGATVSENESLSLPSSAEEDILPHVITQHSIPQQHQINFLCVLKAATCKLVYLCIVTWPNFAILLT